MALLPDLKYSILKFHLLVDSPMRLPPFKGSTIRGGFGTAFRRAVCVTRKDSCDKCILRDNCVFSYVFETPVPSNAEILRKYPKAPHPFVIDPPLSDKREFQPGEGMEFDILLIGRAVGYAPYFMLAFEMLGKMGLGKMRGKFRVISVENGGETIYSNGLMKGSVVAKNLTELDTERKMMKRLKITFLTPTRMLYQGERVDVPEFHVIIRSLLRRLYLLNYFHGDSEFAPDFKGLIQKAEGVRLVKAEILDDTVVRYSTRQERKVSMLGFKGTFVYEGDIGEFYPLLKAGEIIHIGKATAFGFGKYKIEEV